MESDHAATNSPPLPPISASTSLLHQQLTDETQTARSKASRIAISRWRDEARASSKPATSRMRINRTSPTTVISRNSDKKTIAQFIDPRLSENDSM